MPLARLELCPIPWNTRVPCASFECPTDAGSWRRRKMGLSESKDWEANEGSPKSQEEAGEAEEATKPPLLHVAAKQGHYDQAQQLLLGGTQDLNRQDSGGRTPLFWATEYRHEALVELLLSHGADTAVRDNEGNLSLHWAALVGSASIARRLLEAGSELNAPNAQGDSPTHLAARERRYECLVLFLAQGAKLSLRNAAGLLPLECAQAGSPSWRALQAFSALPPGQVEKVLSRDISRGFERVPVPCLNGLDGDPCPGDFLYVTQNVVSSSVIAPPTGWARSQHCKCEGGVCSPSGCPCILHGQRPCYTQAGRLVVNAAQSAARAGLILHECHLLCSCPISCANRVVQGGLRVQLQLFKTEAKGWGVRTMQDVPPETFICQYFGELISSAEAAEREEDAFCFMLDVQAGPECCLDGRFYGNVGRFLNHSCQPNLVALQVATGHQGPGIAFFSSRAIQAGEELGFDYGDRFWAVKVRGGFVCRCHSPHCRYPGPAGPESPAAAAAGDPTGWYGLRRRTPPLRGFALKSKRSCPLKRGGPAPERAPPRRRQRPNPPALPPCSVPNKEED